MASAIAETEKLKPFHEKRIKGILCIGILLKGESHHYEYLSTAVANTLSKLSTEIGVPLIYGVLNCLSFQQAESKVEAMEKDSQVGEFARALRIQIDNYKCVFS